MKAWSYCPSKLCRKFNFKEKSAVLLLLMTNVTMRTPSKIFLKITFLSSYKLFFKFVSLIFCVLKSISQIKHKSNIILRISKSLKVLMQAVLLDGSARLLMTSELNRFKVVSNELKMERIAESDEVFKSLTLSTLSLGTVISDAPSVLTPLIPYRYT